MAEARIRKVTPDDRAGYDRLMWELDYVHHLHTPSTIRHPDEARVPDEDFQRFVGDPNMLLACAETDGRMTGLIRAVFTDGKGSRAHRPARYARIEEIVVLPAARRTGIAHVLMLAARAWAREKGATSLELSVYAFNTAARHFYEREGFVPRAVHLTQPLE